jgi:predicted phage tail protein
MSFERQDKKSKDAMTMNVATRDPRSKELSSTTDDQRQLAPRTADAAVFDKERLADIRQELVANQQHLPERIAATVEEDYQQLLKDFGLR